jgi:hypothetical protein
MKSTFRRHNKTSVKTTRKNKTNKKSIKSSNKYRRTRSRKNRRIIKNKMYKGGNNDINCCMCNKKQNIENTLVPSKCFQKNMNKAHRICRDCWWDKFALENMHHDCPGCKKNLPLTNTENTNSNQVIDLT